MNDYIAAFWVALILAIVLVIWIIIDLRARDHIARAGAAGAVQVAQQAVAMAMAGECARAWITNEAEGYRVHICPRPYEHTGPCDCGICSEGLDR